MGHHDMAYQIQESTETRQRGVAIRQLRNREVRPHLEDQVNNKDAEAKDIAPAICQPRGQK